MRSWIASAILFLGANAMASTVIQSNEHTCRELKQIIKTQGEALIQTRLGTYEVYPNTMTCFNQGLQSDYLTVRASDRTCTVGFVCDYYFGGM